MFRSTLIGGFMQEHFYKTVLEILLKRSQTPPNKGFQLLKG